MLNILSRHFLFVKSMSPMTLPILLKKYNIDVKQLKSRLNKVGLETNDFKYIREVPEAWIKVLENNYVPPKKVENLTKRKDDSNKNIPTLKGLKVIGEIDKDKFKKPNRRKYIPKENQVIPLTSKIGIIKRLLERHGYVRIFNDVTDTRFRLSGKDSSTDFVFDFEDSTLFENQILCIDKIIGRRGTKAIILEHSFLGTFHPTNSKKLIVFQKNYSNTYLSYNSDEIIVNPSGIFKFKLDYEYSKGTIVSDLKEVIDVHKLMLDDLKIYFTDFIESRSWIKKESQTKIVLAKILLQFDTSPDFFSLIQEKELKGISISNATKAIPLFLNEWSTITKSTIKIETIKNRKSFNKSIWINAWLDDTITLPEKESEKNEIILSGLKYRNEQSLQISENIFTKLNLPTKQRIELIHQLFDSFTNIETEEELDYYSDSFFIGLDERLNDKFSSKISKSKTIELWLKNGTKIPSLKTITSTFSSLDNKVKSKVLDQLEIEDVITILNGNSNDAKEFADQIIFKIESYIKNNISFLAFDLEVRDELSEIGYISETTNHFYELSSDDEKDKLEILSLIMLLNKTALIIGHNILNFDLPILKKNYVIPDEGKVWDTMIVEFLLSPSIASAALNTEHTALADSEKSFSLFLNQFLRIAILPEHELNNILTVLPTSIHNQIKVINNLTKELEQVLTEELEEHKNQFFQTKKPNTFIELVSEKINELEVEKVIIKSPTFLHNDFTNLKDVCFLGEETNYLNTIIDEEKINNTLTENDFVSVSLKRFISKHKQNNTIARYSELSPYLKRIINSKFDSKELCSTPNISIKDNNYKIFCVDLDFILNQKDDFLTVDNIGYLELGNDLSLLIEKKLIAELNYDAFNNLPETENAWLNFSGGQSYMSITKQQLIGGNIELPHKGYDNYWVERNCYDSYLIWANVSNPSFQSMFTSDRKAIISFEDLELQGSSDFKPQIMHVANRQMNALLITRLNPETRSRDLYWSIQSKLIRQVATFRKSNVLFINDINELENLTNWFTSLGYYIPSVKASLHRQIELLVDSNDFNKMSIQPLNKLAEIVAIEVESPLNYIIDSFEISDKWYAIKNSNFFKRETKEETNNEFDASSYNSNEEDSEESQSDGNAPTLPLRNDTGALLEIFTPLIHYYRYIIEEKNTNNEFYLLDPRLENRYEIKRLWNCEKRKARMWSNKEAYDEDLVAINNFFPSKTLLENLNIDIEDSMERIRKIFIGKEHDYYEFQIPYIKEILKAEKDLLVTLPTGGGKSVLFQGPALYRSSFTRGLTLVISPLKALMEDQVQQLWKLGFWSSVDYLNQDKGMEVQNIYRKMAGGEINLLFITPERFRSRSFEVALKTRIKADGGLDYCVFDEAHCISQWGNEFRPDYQRCARITWKMKRGAKQKFPILLFSATVSEQIYNDFNRIFQ